MEKERIEELLKALSGYLEATDLYEVVYSKRRGYAVLRWDEKENNYYGVMVIHRAAELAIFVYRELMARIALETGSDHTISNRDLDPLELDEARAATAKFILCISSVNIWAPVYPMLTIIPMSGIPMYQKRSSAMARMNPASAALAVLGAYFFFMI